ncbi:MAG: substrate-binding domain-containing protein [Prevotellaceae bacterium]|jgi:phosphate transport system substrate-binding protein|nr:substrate-binding domain-containing protein [Prevotellaceae bacterium]
MVNGWYKPVGWFLLCLLLVACKGKRSAPDETLFSGVIRIAADETLAPVVQEELDVFEALYVLAGIIPRYTNEVEAMNLLLMDSIRFAVATRPFSEGELKALRSRKFIPQSVKIATDGLALIVHKSNPDSIMSVSALQKIFSGRVTAWNELFPRRKAQPVYVVYDNPNSSTVRYVKDSICRGEKLSEQSYAVGSNPKVIEYVARTPNAIGVIGVNWISEEQDSVSREFSSSIQVVRVSRDENPTYANSCQPYQYYLHTGEYPFRREVYINLNDPRSGLPSGLTNFMASARGQRIILKAGLLPATMPVNVVHTRDNL